MEDAGFIVTSYVVTLASVAAYAWHILRGARRRARHTDRKEMPWT